MAVKQQEYRLQQEILRNVQHSNQWDPRRPTLVHISPAASASSSVVGNNLVFTFASREVNPLSLLLHPTGTPLPRLCAFILRWKEKKKNLLKKSFPCYRKPLAAAIAPQSRFPPSPMSRPRGLPRDPQPLPTGPLSKTRTRKLLTRAATRITPVFS